MSLEENLVDLTLSINKLVDVLGAAKVAPKKATPAKKAGSKIETPAPVAEVVTDTPKLPAEGFDVVGDLTRQLGVEKGREAVVGILAAFKIAKASELKTEQYTGYIAKVRELLAEVAEEDLVG